MAAERLRVLLIAGLVPHPPIGGARSKLYYLLREQARRHEIDLLLFPMSEPESDDLTALRPLCRRLECEVLRPPSWMTKLRGFLSPLPIPAFLAQSTPVARRVARALDECEYDLIHLEGYFLGQCLVGLATPPRLIVPHDAYWWNYKENLYLRSGLARLAALWEMIKVYRHEPRLYRAYDAVSMCTELDARAVRPRCPSVHFGVVSNGVALEEQLPRPGLEEFPSLVFSGSYRYPPNEEAALRLLTRIAPALRQIRPELKVFIVGDAPTPPLVELGRHDQRNVISGRVPVMADWIARGSVYVSPLVHGTGFKNKVPEAWAMRRPLVATPKTMEGIHFTPGVHALVADSDKALIDACGRLLGDRRLRRQMATAGRRRVEEEYNWPTLAANLDELYRFTTLQGMRSW